MALTHARAGQTVDLRPLGARPKQAKTAAIARSDRFEAIRLIVPAGKEIPSHKVEGEITLHCLEGRVSLGLAQATIELSAGEWAYLDGGERHDVKGVEDSSLLLTILFDRPQG